MPRLPRLKVEGSAAVYHLSARVSAARGEYPLADPVMAEKLIGLTEFYTTAYFCSVAAINIMGNHYHLIVRFDEPRQVDRMELETRAQLLYQSTRGRRTISQWTDLDWEVFHDRLFNVSELMRNLQGSYATWYNRVSDRRGGLWAERYNSVILGDEGAVLDCMLYVELNAVRAGLVERPEDWRPSSLHMREVGKADWLMPLTEILPSASEAAALVEYRSLVYHRGAVPTKPGQVAISEELLQREAERGFAAAGAFRRRWRHLSEGLFIAAQTTILEFAAERRQSGQFPYRKDPIAKLGGLHWVLREQYRQRSPT